MHGRAPLLDRSSVYYYTDYVVGEPSQMGSRSLKIGMLTFPVGKVLPLDDAPVTKALAKEISLICRTVLFSYTTGEIRAIF